MISLVEQKYEFFDTIDAYHGLCINNDTLLVYRVKMYKYEIFAPPESFLNEVLENKIKLKKFQQLKQLTLLKQWKIDEVREII